MLFPRSCAVTKVQELFYGCGAETVDRTHLTVELFHQVEGASLIGMDQHAVKHQLLFRGEETKQAFQTGDMIHGQLQGFRQALMLFTQGSKLRGTEHIILQVIGDPGEVVMKELDCLTVILQIMEIGQKAVAITQLLTSSSPFASVKRDESSVATLLVVFRLESTSLGFKSIFLFTERRLR